MKFDRWYGLGWFSVLLVGISWQYASFNGEVISLCLTYGLLGYGMTRQALTATTEGGLRRWSLTEVGFLLQAFLVVALGSLILVLTTTPRFATLADWQQQLRLAGLWPINVPVVALLLVTVTLVGLQRRGWRLRQGVVRVALALGGLILISHVGWLTARGAQMAPSLYGLPLALGSCLATRRFPAAARPTGERLPAFWFAVASLLVVIILGMKGAPLTVHWQLLAVIVLVSLIVSWAVINAQTRALTVRHWQVWRVLFMSSLLLSVNFTLITRAGLGPRIITVGLVLVVALADTWGYRRYQRHNLNAKQLTMVFVGLGVVLTGVLGWQVNRVTAIQTRHGQPAHAAVAVKKTVPSATKTTAKAPTSRAQTTPAQQKAALQRRWRQIIDGQDAKAGIAIYDLHTKQTVSYTKDPDGSGFVIASTVKVGILTELLHRRDQGQLTYRQLDQNEAVEMIQNSDNQAATYLLSERLGSYESLGNLYHALGMTHTTADSEAWGMSTTTPSDQLRLLRTVYQPNDYLSTKSQRHIQALMSQVSSDQDWGISKAADDYQLKNGWIDSRSEGNGCQINSIGRVDGPSGYLIAIYTNQDETMASGVQLVEKLAKATHTILRP
ncbi:serine hydrolase [Lactiplantibacillus modestisalitolerans]|uniref:Serine hydrolase n=1 Tax=Lactiplantibacillus modestisalitolerans TaxID=1457219 RepID=A0ABV5WUT4_9LACO|nr:serine hydrolase [Lactiplantibacillus modestisalitolerans]